MNVRRLAAMALLVILAAAWGRATGSAAQDDKASDSEQSLSVRLAQAELKLAEMNLARIQAINKKVPGTFITGMVQNFSNDVERAQFELKVAKTTGRGDSYQVTMERLALALQMAEERAKRALATYEQSPQVVTKEDVERMRQMAIIAELQLQRGRALANASPQEKVQWQLEVVSNELDRVRVYTYLLGQKRLGEFAPGGL
ncbi:MAG: hypothetical protein DWQ37_12890 [Planctomycetota bacterium]|nr:MAG: hypothetical protein DWQ37_12890 [Planctomycetota bacterium]